ncbi:hypothetical protein HanIR_Chr14g0682401 [Helianthus annuus]|nr:hypothetical protein HanIR_Chr14g0682401 [Helianthus annuus]
MKTKSKCEKRNIQSNGSNNRHVTLSFNNLQTNITVRRISTTLEKKYVFFYNSQARRAGWVIGQNRFLLWLIFLIGRNGLGGLVWIVPLTLLLSNFIIFRIECLVR